MNKTSDQIAADLRLKRQAFHASVEELQAKLKSVTDWRQQFEQHPVMMIAAAMGAGALLATVAGRAERRRATPPVSAVASPHRPVPVNRTTISKRALRARSGSR